MVTGATLYKERAFEGRDLLTVLQNSPLEAAQEFSFFLEAWAVFSNHYHFVAHAPNADSTLRKMVQRYHSETARLANERSSSVGRRVWFQYWDTRLTFEKSLYPRLNYVHNNPVKHGLVSNAEDYEFCSARWFRTLAEPAFYRKVSSFRYDRLKIRDDF